MLFLGLFGLVAAAGYFAEPFRLYAEDPVHRGIEFNDSVLLVAFVLMMAAYPARIVASNIPWVGRTGWALDGAVAGLSLGSLLGDASLSRTATVLSIGVLAALLVAFVGAKLAEHYNDRHADLSLGSSGVGLRG